jgi:Leucine-rich repeat (LRR) protein
MSWMLNLATLSVPHSNLTDIPAEFGYMYNLQTLEHYGNPLSCLPRSVKRIFNFQGGNYLPACSNHTVEAFLTNRVAQKGTCEGFGTHPSVWYLSCIIS